MITHKASLVGVVRAASSNTTTTTLYHQRDNVLLNVRKTSPLPIEPPLTAVRKIRESEE